MDKDWIEKIKDWRERQDQILEIYEAGVSTTQIAKELRVSRTRVYQLIRDAKERREKLNKAQEEAVGPDQ